MGGLHGIYSITPKQQQKKLLHLLWEYPPNIVGGLGIAGAHLCEALSELANVEVIIPESPHPEPADNGVILRGAIISGESPTLARNSNVYCGPYSSHGCIIDKMGDFEQAVMEMPMDRPGIIHAHDWLTAPAATVLKQKFSVPMILHIHSTEVERRGAFSKGVIFQREKAAMENADAIITVSKMTKRVLMRHYGISADKIRVVHLSGTLEGRPLERSMATDGKRVLLFAGRMVAQKSPVLATEIICQVLKRNPDWAGMMVGDGEMLEVVRQLISFKGMANRVEVLGKVPHDSMPLIYAAADALIMPSAAEPFGLVAAEAVQAGTAVVVSTHSGIREVLPSAPALSIQDIQPWVDRVEEMLANDQKREKLVTTLQSELAEIQWQSTAECIMKLVDELTA